MDISQELYIAFMCFLCKDYYAIFLTLTVLTNVYPLISLKENKLYDITFPV